ncbi:MAG: hypothetical protein IIA88_12360 [Bacteroidetes bacterium]|nr:hypothetical protein [Bacteroidota bacterium]
MKISDYFQNVENILYSTPLVYSIDIHTEAIDIYFGYFNSKIIFYDASKLYLFELVEIVKETPYIEKYRYHYQDKNNKLIKRWDNAPHYPILINISESFT